LNRLTSVIMLSQVPGPIAADRAVGYFVPAQQIAHFPLGLLFGLRRLCSRRSRRSYTAVSASTKSSPWCCALPSCS
jgi:hypothetical protein